MEKIVMTLCESSLTSTGKKEGVRWVRLKLIGLPAEIDLRAYLLAAGIELGPDEDPYR
jgi:hypothetical protein